MNDHLLFQTRKTQMTEVPPELKIGDIVTLITGGPRMVVVRINDDKQSVVCTWFSSTEEYFRDQFPCVALKKE